MPSLATNKLIGALRFQSHGLMLPTEYDQIPPDERQTYMSLLSPSERVAVPQLVPAWFKPELPIAPHQLMCDHVGQSFKDMHDTLVDAVAYGHTMWRLQAKFGPMPIAGPVVAGPPGCLIGPPLAPLIQQFPACAAMTPSQVPYRDAVIAGVSQAFLLWQSGVTVPGLPLFPAYVMQPPGAAIPSPSIPQKLIACVSADVASIMVPASMKALMVAAFPASVKENDPPYDAFFDAVSTVLALAFTEWLSNQMVIGIIGSGAVASAVGGPVAGITLPTAGHLAA